MSKRVNIVGAKPKKVHLRDHPQRKIDPAVVAAAAGASLIGRRDARQIDLLGLADVGTELLARLRSTGGRPALHDASVNCRVPLSEDDVECLEAMVRQIGASAGVRPSVGQLASVIVRQHLVALQNKSDGIRKRG